MTTSPESSAEAPVPPNGALGSGTFEIKLDFQPPYATPDGLTLGRAIFTKQFQGDLTGTSTGEMLSTLTSVKGSAGYISQEHIQATLHGRTGSFVVHHVGRMTRGAAELTITIVPDSGTGELQGITGQMTIDKRDGQQFYSIDYKFE